MTWFDYSEETWERGFALLDTNTTHIAGFSGLVEILTDHFGLTKDTKGSVSFSVSAHVHICVEVCTYVREKETGGCSGTPVHVPVTGCRLRGSSTDLALGHLAAKERCPSWSHSNWIAAIGLATWKLSFSFISTKITSDIPCHIAGPLNGCAVKLENH